MNEEITEELPKVGIVRLVVEAESATVVEEDAEFVWEAAVVVDEGGGGA